MNVNNFGLRIILKYLYCFATLVGCRQAFAQPCYPPYFGGIVAGITLDRDVVTLYGKGFFTDSMMAIGARYYTDSLRSVTMEVELGVDHMIDRITIQTGVHFPSNGPRDVSPFVSARLDPRETMTKSGLGSSRDEVEKELGKPTRAMNDGQTWEYAMSASKECAIYPTMTFWFSYDRVTKIEYDNGE